MAIKRALLAAALFIATGWPASAGDLMSESGTARSKPDRAQMAAQPAHGGKAPHWSYGGMAGPDRWGELSPEYRLCSGGHSQSPIDLTTAEYAQMAEIERDYRLTPLTIANNGHTVQINYAEGSGITIGGRKFALVQFHFHTNSEHLIDGRAFPMEIHFVHENAAGELAVIGVLVEKGEENLGLKEIWHHLPAVPGPAQRIDRTLINGRDLIPMKSGYYRYMGSLTTPPCSEGVNWFVLRTPITASAAQMAAIARIMGSNARPKQPRNHRLVLRGGPGR